MKKSRLSPAFTLIELLVVIALIGVLAGGIGLALGTGDRSTSLQNAQSLVNSGIAGVRAQAAVNLTDAGLFINATPGSDGFMREFRIGVHTDTNNDGTPDRWVVRGDPIFLPSGIYLVPSTEASFTSSEVDFQPNTADWLDSRTTTGPYDNANITLWLRNNTTEASSDRFHRITILNQRGVLPNVTQAGSIALAPADRSSTGGLVFRNIEFVRGLRIGTYGVTTFADGKASLN